LLQTCEELAELMQAISKAKRYEGQSYIDGVAEEIADVQNETPKTFTQAEVDEIVRRRLARASKAKSILYTKRLPESLREPCFIKLYNRYCISTCRGRHGIIYMASQY
ncbi:MAG: hypothetical protein ILP19_07775, partial [Oscillospiraceae bacterium]|nr:hypothetical protein [Oscillospiraceae bacterium]